MKKMLLGFALFLGACGGGGGGASPPVVLPAPGWNILYSVGMPATLNQNNAFTFPQPPGSVHYVMRHANSGGNHIRMRYRIEGDGALISTQDGGPGQVTLIIQRRGDTLLADKPSHRFWAGSLPLMAGEYTIEVPLDPDLWTNVFGQHDPDGFTATVNDLENVGFTFGNPHAGATGHGVHTTGNAYFTLLEYTVE